jgi:ABC-type phosphate/phosphonate transport system substrate-binding protein
VVPYLPALTLIERYAPLARHLEESLGRKVAVATAPDVLAFLKRALAGEYEFLVSGPGPGRYLQRERQCRVLAVSERPVQAVFLVRADGPLRELRELAGQTIAAPERFTTIAQLGEAMLRRDGLQNGRDYRFAPPGSFANALEALAVGDLPAALTAASTWEQLAPERRRALREIARSEALPGLLILHCPPAGALPYPPTRLLAFAAGTSGRAFVSTADLIGLRAPAAGELSRMDEFLPAFRRELER